MVRATRIAGGAVALLLLAVGAAAAAGAQAPGAEATGQPTPSPAKAELQRLYFDYLRDEGYRPEIDGDGDVRFKREGRVYFVLIDEEDREYFRLVLPNIWPIESEAERQQVLAAADYSNRLSKVCKIHTLEDDVWVGIELFVARPEDFRGVFARSLRALDNGVANFVAKMRE